MKSFVETLQATLLPAATLVARHGGRPPAAIELASQGVVAATGRPAVYAFAPLPEGALVPGIAEENIRSMEPVVAAIRAALDPVRPPRRAITVLLPDTAVRVFVLDFESIPARTEEALAVLRFRLRKVIPFEVEKAAISYQVLSQQKEQCRVLAAVVPGPVREEYEAAVRKAGYEPGALLPASLAALETVETGGSLEATLTATLSPEALICCISTTSDLLLYRILTLPEDEQQRALEIQRGVAVAVAFYEDKLQAPPRTLRYTGTMELAEFQQIAALPELNIEALTPRPETGALTGLGTASLAGVTGALAGAY